MGHDVENLIHQINRAWLDGRPHDIRTVLHPEVVMVFPEFAGRSSGADAMIEGFVEFCKSSTVLEFEATDVEVDVVGSAAVVSYSFSVTYDRGSQRYKSRGRDLWVFGKVGAEWKASWRTMLDLHDEEA